jgi:predicted RNA methylase
MRASLERQALSPEERALSQFQTPMWLARRMAGWVWRGARVLEPCAGHGNLVAALLELGHDARNIIAVERDPRCALALTERFADVGVTCADFLQIPAAPRIDCVLMNSPFEGDQMLRFTLRALECAREVVLVAPVAIEFSIGRDDGLWRERAVVVRRARLPRRPRFGGDQGGKFDCVVLKLKRRDEPRREDEVVQVSEEVWREG